MLKLDGATFTEDLAIKAIQRTFRSGWRVATAMVALAAIMLMVVAACESGSQESGDGGLPTPTPLPTTEPTRPAVAPQAATPVPFTQTPDDGAVDEGTGAVETTERDAALAILLDEVVRPEELGHLVAVFGMEQPLTTGDEVAAYAPDPLPEEVEELPFLVPHQVTSEQWFFWVDDVPFARFSHPTRYALVDLATGVVEVWDEGWWPYINGVVVEEWMELGRLGSDEVVFSNIPPEDIPAASTGEGNQRAEVVTAGPILLGYAPSDAELARWSLGGGEAVVPLNGWSPGQSDVGTADDMANSTGFSSDTGTPQYQPRGNTQQDIEDAIQRAIDGGANDILIYFTGHGGRRASGESYINYKGTRINATQFGEMLKKFPQVKFKVVIDACYSGGFTAILDATGMTQVVITSSAANEVSYGDWDPRADPNGDTDRGGEYSSGFWEDLAEIAADLDLKNKAESRAQAAGLPLLVGWLSLAHESAMAKDATALDGTTHPQVVLSDPRNPTPTPVVPTATPTATPTLAPASTPNYDRIMEAARQELILGNLAKDLGDILDSISFEEPTFVNDVVKINLYDAYTIELSDLEVKEIYNESVFECGTLTDGRLVVCADEVLPMPAGTVYVLVAIMKADIPVADPDRHYIYSAVFDSDGDPANDFQFFPPYDWDYFQGTDRWYQVFWDANLGEWGMDVTQLDGAGGGEIVASTARVVIEGDTIVFFISAEEFPSADPGYRLTTFGHDGFYSPNDRGGDVTGENPTEPLARINR